MNNLLANDIRLHLGDKAEKLKHDRESLLEFYETCDDKQNEITTALSSFASLLFKHGISEGIEQSTIEPDLLCDLAVLLKNNVDLLASYQFGKYRAAKLLIATGGNKS